MHGNHQSPLIDSANQDIYTGWLQNESAMLHMTTRPRPVINNDLTWMHVLNELHAVELSSLTSTQFARLAGQATYATAIDDEAAFLLAFDQDAGYDGLNFHWFKARHPRFVYVDRIAVSASHRGKGLARLLYQDLFRKALSKDIPVVVCEVNSDPPNPASEAFHTSLGFAEVGQAKLETAGKTVRYLSLELPLHPS